MPKYGLIGRSISYSFSPGYFNKKFEDLGMQDHSYEIYDLASIEEFPDLLKSDGELRGLNVTIPYKEAVIPYLEKVDPVASEIGAVNTICIQGGKTIGFNTDVIGFENVLKPLLLAADTKALVLGTGGASKAVRYVLEKLGIKATVVSRRSGYGQITYDDLNPEVIRDNPVIINCTPLGTFPDVEAKPPLPYRAVSEKHLLFDLIYNPEKTAFLRTGEKAGSRICNGYGMLVGQAEASWELWQGV